LSAAQQLLSFDTGLTLVQADNTITSNAYSYAKTLQDAVSSTPKLNTQFPVGNQLTPQLQQIAQIMSARSALGATRHIFFVSMGSFDTHDNQTALQDGLFAQLSSALAAFYQATEELGIANQVTTFTMSDFCRALQPNTTSGSDHAWGSHHMVMGGAVNGGQIYGTYPTLALGGPDDAGANGRWIPSLSSSQYAATLASWFGVQASDLATVLPCLPNFNNQNLGFV
jgi:uncharacterized protein (DUF1501 family)